ncbi:protein of unknown function [Bradyrhizobium vignae]|uniref:Uncharacterized protein n=1 Tax=Bradyrhizobium vignae TaxID=1549949 RepID=A0A2U3PWF2_9BRAD|nr:protein of unknown function [Bradyrhizobium vignae]
MLKSSRTSQDVRVFERLSDTSCSSAIGSQFGGAPVGFDPDESHYGLIWTGEPELSGTAHHLAQWLQEQCKSFI